jgi:FAD/FMN-containing dehydrogenase
MSVSDDFAVLRRSFAGRLLLPGDDAFDSARTPWNLAVEQHPAVVAYPADLSDLQSLLRAARDSGAPLAVQTSGHGASGDLAGAVLVRMDGFDELSVDLERRVATVGAGVPWGTVIAALEGTGWAAPSGTSPVVTVAGYTLSGGHSWFSRTVGLGSDNLRAAWVLRPDGSHERVDDDRDADSMWALRGAGGIVGVVTALEIDLVPVPAMWGASMVFDPADSAQVIRAVRDLSPSAPHTLNIFLNSMRLPDAPQLPEEVRGRSFLAVQALSTEGEASGALAEVRAAGRLLREETGPTSPATLAAQSNEPTDPTPGRGASAALTALDDATIDALVEYHRRPEQWPVFGIDMRMLGGALRTPRRPGFARLDSSDWLMHALAPLLPGTPPEPGAVSLEAFRSTLAPVAADTIVPTFLEPGQTLDRAGDADEVSRLRSIRRRVDPDAVLSAGRLPR